MFKTLLKQKTGRKMCMNFPSHQSKSISEICYLSTILTHKKQGIKQHEKHPNHRPSLLTRCFLHSLGRLMLALFFRQASGTHRLTWIERGLSTWSRLLSRCGDKQLHGYNLCLLGSFRVARKIADIYK